LQVLTKRGVDIAYIGGSSSVIAAGGFCPEAGNIALWDTLSPISAGAIAHLTHHAPLVTAIQVRRTVWDAITPARRAPAHSSR
jgi:hypothetical protein